MRERRISGPDRDWLTLEQCADYMGVSPATLTRQVERKRFPPGVPVSDGKRKWNWLDCIAYMHMQSRLLVGDTEVEDDEEK